MPKRESGEPLSKFISRFVGDKAEEKKFPDRKQRLAVGYAEAREFDSTSAVGRKIPRRGLGVRICRCMECVRGSSRSFLGLTSRLMG